MIASLGRSGMTRALPFVLRLMIGGVFVYAGVMKAAGPQRFALDIESYRILPATTVGAAALYLPWVEIIGGLGLFVRRTVPGATLLTGGLMGVFTVALLSAWLRGLEIRCGCFGGDTGREADYFWWLARDLALLAACVILWKRTASGASDASLAG